MAENSQKYTAVIEINSQQAKARLSELEKEIADLRKQAKEAANEGTAEGKKRAQQLQKEIDQKNRLLREEKKHVQGLNDALQNLSEKTYKDLQQEVRALNKLMRGGTVRKGTEEWKAMAERIKDAKREMREYELAVTEQKTVWQKFFKFLNDSWGGVAVILSSITGLSMTIRKSVQSFADMEEEMADVRKYTGLTADQVKDLNEEFKKMDTRTSREQLNQLAGAAGRLGITSKESILEFVDAADKIGVALGDDLGEGAVDQIGKLAMAFGEDDRLGLRGAMLATGSAVNELAQNSAANAGYLVEFTARVAGVGKQLGLTQAQIMGFGTVMDEALLKDEMASTAFSQMITKMATDSAKFAQFAGMEVSKFSELVKNDLNSAILALADNMRKQDPTVMLKMFGDMGLDGTRAVGVLTNMADKIDDVRRHQQTATEAYEQATSVVGEFSTMNNTVQAQIDKCKKRFNEMAIELGERLLPVVQYTISGFSLMVKGLSVATAFVMEHKTELLSAAAAIAAYTAVIEAKTIAERAGAVATKAMTLATELFNKVTKMNPIGIVVAALTAATLLFIKYRDRINGASEATTMLRKAGARLLDILSQVTGWMVTLIQKAVSLYDRFAFIRKIFQLLTVSFTTGFSVITNGVKLLIDELGAVANVIEGIFTLDWDKIKDGYKQSFKAVADAATTQLNIVKRTMKDVFSAPTPARAASPAITSASGGSPAATPASPAVATVPVVSPTGKLTDYKTEEEKRKEEQARKKAEADRKRRLKEAEDAAKAETDTLLAQKTHEYAMGLVSYRQYIQDMAKLQTDGLQRRRDVYEKGSAEYEKLNRQLQERLYKGDEQANRLRLEELQRDMLLQQAEIEAQAAREEITEQEKQEALRMLQESFLADKVELYRKGTKERLDAEWELEQTEQKNRTDREREYMQRLSQIRQETGRADYDRLQQIELDGAKSFYSVLVAQGRMTEDEYDAIIDHIRKKYASLKADQAAGNDISAKASQSLSTAKKAAGTRDAYTGSDAATGISGISTAIENQRLINDELKRLYGEDYENNREYQEAKRQLDQETMQTIVAGAQAAYSTISTALSAASSYAQACSDLEVARITANYDKQIEAAGKNTKKREKLEKEKEKAIAEAKTKANKKAMVIEMAQAVAQSALGAISAYSSTMAGAPYPANLVLAPISAGIALAAGALQIATIKKQHQAEEAGYYEGGFTPGNRYRRQAGIVHEGEFVANHQAVNNPAILPFLNFIDQAQRNNTVGSLTAQDVARQFAGGGSPASSSPVLAPVVNVQNDNSDLRDTLTETQAVLDRLTARLNEPFGVDIPIDGDNGIYRQLRRYENLLNNK